MLNFSLSIKFYIFHIILLNHHHKCKGSWATAVNSLNHQMVCFSLIHLCLFLWSTSATFTINSLISSFFFFDPPLYIFLKVHWSNLSFSLIHSCKFHYKFIDPHCFFLGSTPCFTDLPPAAVEVGSFSSPTRPHWDHCLRSHYLHPINEQVIVMNKS